MKHCSNFSSVSKMKEIKFLDEKTKHNHHGKILFVILSFNAYVASAVDRLNCHRLQDNVLFKDENDVRLGRP